MRSAPALFALCVLPVLSLGCAAPVGAPDPVASSAQADESADESADAFAPLSVDFAGCTETADVGIAPVANIRPLVPAEFTLVETGGSAEIVVRGVHCDGVAVDRIPTGPADLIQIGAVIVAPQGDGDINNYMLYYDTNSVALTLGLQSQGVPASFVPTLQTGVKVNPDGTGEYHFDVPAPFEPQLTFAGPVGAPSTSPIPFTANWWFNTDHGTVKMATALPELFGAGNDVVLTVPRGSRLADILGTTTVSSWPVLVLFDTFPTAHMNVAVADLSE